MLVSCDAAQLEWRVAALLSQDEVMLQEIRDKVDAHSMNCTDLMELPLTDDNRTDAKVFSFRMIYGGTAYAFYMDSKMPDFTLKKWEQIVENFYQKYRGLYLWQKKNFKEVQVYGKLISPVTGRIWTFNKYNNRGAMEYKWAEVCNYPVQGTAFDFIALWMQRCYSDLVIYPDVKLIMQIHDDILWDCPPEYVDIVANVLYNRIVTLGESIEKFFKYPVNVPFGGDVKIGETWGTLTKWIH